LVILASLASSTPPPHVLSLGQCRCQSAIISPGVSSYTVHEYKIKQYQLLHKAAAAPHGSRVASSPSSISHCTKQQRHAAA
jgi:hypothetical protein